MRGLWIILWIEWLCYFHSLLLSRVFAAEKAILLVKLREATLEEMMDKISKLEGEVFTLKDSQKSQDGIKQVCLDYEKSCQERMELARSLEDLWKSKLDMKDEILLLKEKFEAKIQRT